MVEQLVTSEQLLAKIFKKFRFGSCDFQFYRMNDLWILNMDTNHTGADESEFFI